MCIWEVLRTRSRKVKKPPIKFSGYTLMSLSTTIRTWSAFHFAIAYTSAKRSTDTPMTPYTSNFSHFVQDGACGHQKAQNWSFYAILNIKVPQNRAYHSGVFMKCSGSVYCVKLNGSTNSAYSATKILILTPQYKLWTSLTIVSLHIHSGKLMNFIYCSLPFPSLSSLSRFQAMLELKETSQRISMLKTLLSDCLEAKLLLQLFYQSSRHSRLLEISQGSLGNDYGTTNTQDDTLTTSYQ